ncbi:hypothetical protein Q7P35_009139 [Cladosporium inversicolor]
MSYTWQSIGAVSILGLTTLAAYLKHKHINLEAKANRHIVKAQERSIDCNNGNLQSLPQALLSNPNALPFLHEKCSIHIPIYTISNDTPEHFTRLLHHNMMSFTRYPQAWIFWLVLPKHRHTFSRSYIERLDFVEGDLVCGVYRVVKAKPSYVELSMEVPPRFGTVAGLLVIRLQARADSGVDLITETLQWTTEGLIRDLPLSKPLPKLLHEFASASLLVSGADLLRSLQNS